jgi:DNA-binding transcriptional ArsR family regulator
MEPHAERAAALLRSLANEQRLMILCNLLERPLGVREINQRVPLSQSALSQHLAVLREAGLVETEKRAQSVVYSLRRGIVPKIIGLLREEFCA